MHSATLDNLEHRRHFIRITALAGIPTQAKYTPPTNEDMYAI
jgi:sulfonate dioxygenase